VLWVLSVLWMLPVLWVLLVLMVLLMLLVLLVLLARDRIANHGALLRRPHSHQPLARRPVPLQVSQSSRSTLLPSRLGFCLQLPLHISWSAARSAPLLLRPGPAVNAPLPAARC